MENNVPEFLIEKLNNQYGIELTKNILEGYTKKRKTTIRINTIKTNVEEIEKELKLNNIKYNKVNWINEALIIEDANEKDISKLKIYEEGKIYLQSLSSMIPPVILDPMEDEDILDMCAAPGSKTTQIAAMVSNNSRITACEMNTVRVERLKYNIEKLGASCIYTMNVDARRLDSFFSFDRILLDAPCSGSGTISIYNRNLEKTFTNRLIEKSVKAQSTLLNKAIEVLKPGKEMVYSTCSILEEENEEILNTILKRKNVELVPIELEENHFKLLPTKIKGTICVMPTEEYEGFFIAKIKKI